MAPGNNNVVQFPMSRIKRSPSDTEVQKRSEYQESLFRKNLDQFVKGVVNDTYLAIRHKYDKLGLETVSDQFNRDYGYIEDAIEALIYRSYGIEHHLHPKMDASGIKFIPDIKEEAPNDDPTPPKSYA